jgi:hypothetical protein
MFANVWDKYAASGFMMKEEGCAGNRPLRSFEKCVKYNMASHTGKQYF